MAFSKATTEERKHWISNYDPTAFVDHSQKDLALSDFINKELVLFSRYDTIR